MNQVNFKKGDQVGIKDEFYDPWFSNNGILNRVWRIVKTNNALHTCELIFNDPRSKKAIGELRGGQTRLTHYFLDNYLESCETKSGNFQNLYDKLNS